MGTVTTNQLIGILHFHFGTSAFEKHAGYPGYVEVVLEEFPIHSVCRLVGKHICALRLDTSLMDDVKEGLLQPICYLVRVSGRIGHF